MVYLRKITLSGNVMQQPEQDHLKCHYRI